MNPSCFKKKLDSEACNHSYPVSDECYRDETINSAARHAGKLYLKNKVMRLTDFGTVLCFVSPGRMSL
jgi:hypothetical protein